MATVAAAASTGIRRGREAAQRYTIPDKIDLLGLTVSAEGIYAIGAAVVIVVALLWRR
jgi:hypothetical protein